MTRLAYALFPTAMANAMISGAFVFCKYDAPVLGPEAHANVFTDVAYDVMHYA